MNGLLNEETMVKLKAGTLSKEELVEKLMGSTPLKQISKGIDVRWEDPVVPRYNGQRNLRVNVLLLRDWKRTGTTGHCP